MRLTRTVMKRLFNLTSDGLRVIAGNRMRPGDLAPVFDAVSTRGRIRLLDYYDLKKVVLIFFCRHSIPQELAAIEDQIDVLEGLGAAVIGIAPGDLDSLRTFASVAGITFPLLPDDGSLSRAFGMERGVVIVDSRRVIRTMKHGPVPRGYILRFLRELEG